MEMPSVTAARAETDTRGSHSEPQAVGWVDVAVIELSLRASVATMLFGPVWRNASVIFGSRLQLMSRRVCPAAARPLPSSLLIALHRLTRALAQVLLRLSVSRVGRSTSTLTSWRSGVIGVHS